MIGDTYLESGYQFLKPGTMYYFECSLYTQKYGGDHIKTIRWEGYTLDWITKWRWYFEYRSALLKVQNPRFDVVNSWGTFQTKVKEDFHLVNLKKNKKDLTTAKRMITKLKNKIEKYIETESRSLLPNWNNPGYLKALEKQKFYEDKKKELEEKINGRS